MLSSLFWLNDITLKTISWYNKPSGPESNAIDKEIDMPLAYYIRLKYHYWFGGLFVTFFKLQIILLSILSLFTECALTFFRRKVG